MDIVFEAPKKRHKWLIRIYRTFGCKVWIIEPFHAYHHKRGVRFFPLHLPPYVEEIIKSGKVSVLKANEINAKEIYLLSADRAVDVIESVFPTYRKRYENIFSYVSDTLKSPVAENVFRINLCNRIAEFYSMNILLHRIEKRFAPDHILVSPDINVYEYLFIKKLLSESNQEFYEHPNIQFPARAYVTSFWGKFNQNLISTAKLLAQTLASGLLRRDQPIGNEKKRNFSYGMTIVSPRQLGDNKRGPGFMVDNKEILGSEVVYFPLIPLTTDQGKMLEKLPGEVYYLKSPRLFSNYHRWRGLLSLSLKQRFLRNGEELMSASNTFLNYFRWQKIMKELSIRHFITHIDFGMGHVGRNLALNQWGVQTWYFTDSANLGVNLGKGGKSVTRHPFWSYLYYDHLVTWDADIAQYYKEHPGSLKEAHIVGCLWSEHIKEKEEARKEVVSFFSKPPDGFYVLSCFDSTYSRNGMTSYEEGIVFAEHLLRLIDEFTDVFVILKEKKERSSHYTLDPVLGPKLIEIYDRMSSHPRVKICSNQVDASELISISDMVVSFPFTSTTFEALSANRPAIWHDPIGYYRDTSYGKVTGVVTHGYEELKSKVLEIKQMKPGTYQNPIQSGSPIMDPYRDGKAIGRFRALLINSNAK